MPSHAYIESVPDGAPLAALCDRLRSLQQAGIAIADRQGRTARRCSRAWMEPISIQRIRFAVVRLSDAEYMNQLGTDKWTLISPRACVIHIDIDPRPADGIGVARTALPVSPGRTDVPTGTSP